MQPTTFPEVFLYMVWITNTDGVLLFQTTPRVLALDTTNSISMKCFWNTSDTRKVDAVSIVKHTKETFQNFATLTKPDDVGQTTCFTAHDKDIEVTYLKHKKGFTLTVSLVKPSLQDVGIYTCHVTGRDQSGSAVSLSEKLTINRFDFKAGCDCTRDQFYFGPETRNDTMYYVSRLLVLNASDADSNCKTIGGYLMEVHDLNEFNIARDLLEKAQVKRAFIAGTDAHSENNWIYLRTGLNVIYVNWANKQPDNNNNEHCLEISFEEGKYGTNDISCTFKNNFLCQISKEL